MNYNKKSVEDIDVAGKRVLCRCDFNVPTKDGKITSDKRIVAALPTIQYLVKHNARVILCSHMGKPKGEWKPELSLKIVAKRISELLGKEVIMAADVAGPDAKAKAAALKDGDGEETEACIAFTGCPWYTYWCLTDTWSDNSVLIQGPQAFYWGGTGLAATANCSDKELARQIIYYTTCNTESMVAINTANGDYVNNKAAIDYIKENGSGTTSTYKTAGGQDIIGFFADKCDGINVLAVGEDQVICEQLLPAAVDAYIANGDLDAALADFAASIHDKYSYLNVK